MALITIGLLGIIAAGLFALTDHTARLMWEIRDVWIGCYWRTENVDIAGAAPWGYVDRHLILYLCLVPTLVLRVNVKLWRVAVNA